MRKLGIIGGMGPLAGCEFYRMLIEATPASCDQDHFDLILSGHASIPDRTEAVESGNSAPLLSAIAEDLNLFAQNNIDLIAIPCNTSHSFYPQLQKLSKVPIFNMVKNACLMLREQYNDLPITLFSTRGTYLSEVYLKSANTMDLNLKYPDKRDMADIMNIIYQVKATQQTRIPEIKALLDKYSANGAKILFACTELSVLVLPEEYKSVVSDSMQMMVDKIVMLMTATEDEYQSALSRYIGV